jgi:hypothetical protein
VFVAVAASAVLAGCASTDKRYLDDLPDVVVHTRSTKTKPVAPLPPPRRGTVTVFAAASWIPPQGIQQRWKCIVVHHSADDVNGPDQIDAFHRQRGWDEMGYHFVIGNGVGYPDGQIYVGSRWLRQKHGAHCKVPGNYYNEHGIGICLIGNFENHRPTPAQMRGLATLCRFLCNECNIPETQVLTHVGITGKTKCPGRHFSLAELHSRLGQTVLATSTR